MSDYNSFRIHCWLLSVFTVIILACVVSWLSLTPRNPRFKISDTQPLALGSKINHPNFSARNYFVFDLEISNPNKRMGIFYDNITLDMHRSRGIIGTNSTPAFYQGYKSTTSFNVMIRANPEALGAHISGGSNTDHYMIQVKTDIRFRIMRWKTKLRRLEYRSTFHSAEYEAQAPGPAVQVS